MTQPPDRLPASRRFVPADRWMTINLVVVAVALAVAVLSDAALTWDGAFYLFRTLDTGKPFVVHDRLIDSALHWPVLWMDKLTDSLAALRATFGLVHVLTPLVSLALSWWVVRKTAPALIIWPILGIGLATLPGQINFISEGIKANQLIWPILLAVLVGLPPRTIPMAGMVALVIMLLHPAAVPILAAVGAAALMMAWLRPADRDRLAPFGTCLLIAALLRYGMIAGGYESGEMNVETQERQWLNSATGLPGVSLAITFGLATLLIGATFLRSASRWLVLTALALVALAGSAFTAWALDPSRWWDALEFRGPANIVSLTAAGFAFVDVILASVTRSDRLRALPDLRAHAGRAIMVAFALVLSLQCLQYGRAIDYMNATLASADERCIEMSALSGMPESPLNLWSTPSLSLLYQGWSPDRVILRDGDCERLQSDGTLAIEATGGSYDSTRIDLLPLQWELGAHGACWWAEPSGWHPAEEVENNRRRWSADTGTIRVFVGEATTVSFTGEIVSFTPLNTVEISVNGEQQAIVEFDTELERPMDDVALSLDAGENVITFDSRNDAGRAPGDPRDLAFSLLNIEPVLGNGGTCRYQT